MLLTKIGQGIVVSIVAVFIVTLLCRLYLSEITKNIVLVDGWKSIALVLAFVLFIQIVAIFMDVIQLKRQRILRDLREE
jgi:Na+-transporting NADH:ubiquinone oxidoreductase subunit NqrE